MPSLGDFTDFDVAADQAEAVEPDTFTFHGETFTVADRVSSIPLMRLAKAATSGMDSADAEGLIALNDFLEQTLKPGDFPRFCDVAMKHGTSDETILRIAQKVYEVIAGRPTTRQSSSSDGLPPTSPSSKRSTSDDDEMVTPEQAVELLRAVG